MERLCVGTDEIDLLVTSSQSRGALLVAEVRMPSGGGPPVMHRHDPEEVYRVSDGELVVYLESGDGIIARSVATSGDAVHIPGGAAHTIRNESDAEAVATVVFTPGTELEGFVRGAAQLAASGVPTAGDVMALAERYGIEMAGPLPEVA